MLEAALGFVLAFVLYHVYTTASLLMGAYVIERTDSAWPAMLFFPGALLFCIHTLPVVEKTLGAERFDRLLRALASLPRKLS